jgi:two-component system response regulator VanR
MSVILLADDERIARSGMRRFLEAEGFKVEVAKDGAEALEKFRAVRPDLVLLDVMMPKCNGFTACTEIRRIDRTVPVVFLTALDSEADLVRGLGLGGDDYISKSAGEGEKLARIRAALARAEAFEEQSSAGRIVLGRIVADVDSLSVMERRRRIAQLTRTEGDILRVLASRRGNIVSRHELIDALRGSGYVCEEGMLYVHVSNLRRKLASAGGMIESERCAGYRLLK